MNDVKKVLKLTKNEIYKFFSKWVVIAFFAVILLGVIVSAAVLKSSPEENYILNEDRWQVEIQDRIMNLTNYLDSDVFISDTLRKQYEDEILICIYQLENDVKPYSSHTASNFILYVNKYFIIIIVLGIIVATKIVTDEYSNKAIYNLLTQPASRNKILLAKIITMIGAIVVSMLMMFILSILIGYLFFGFDSFAVPYLSVVNGEVVSTNILVRALYQLFYNIFALFACAALAIMLSILFKNAIISLVMAEGVYVFGSVIVFQLRSVNVLKYTIFPHLNMQYYLENAMPFNMSPSFSTITLLIYTAIFFAVSFIVFNRRDEKA